MDLDCISCRVIRSCMDYASSKGVDVDDVIFRHGYSYEMIEDSYNWVSVHFFNEVINNIEQNLQKDNIAFEIGCESTQRNSWGDIENVIKAIANPKPILMHVEKFSAYFLKPALIKLEDHDTSSVTIRYTDETGEYINALEFITGAMVSIPKLWGGQDLSAVRMGDGSVRINYSEAPSFFDPENDYKKFSPKLLEEIVVGLEKTKNVVEQKNRELEKKNMQLEKAYRELESAFNSKIQNEKMSVIGTLASGLAHEINNPLSYIMSNFRSLRRYVSSLLDDVKKAKSPISQHVDDIPALISETEEGLGRVKRLVEDINHLSHSGLTEKSYVDISDIVESAIRMSNNAHSGAITINRSYDHKNKIICSPSRLTQVLLNIMLNSISAIEERYGKNKGEGCIFVKTSETKDCISISISDNGQGINPKNIDKIFNPFFTTRKAGKGTGLGLSTSLAIINAHNGSITVESKPKQGTTLLISLPKYDKKVARSDSEPSLF